MGNLTSKYDEYCSNKLNTEKFFCSCYRYKKHGGYENQFECVSCWVIYIFVATGIAVLIGGFLEVIAIVPILADFFEGLISLLSDLFSNFEFLGSWVLSLLQPLIDVFQKLVELLYNLAEFIQNTFPNANERLVNIMISELAA